MEYSVVSSLAGWTDALPDVSAFFPIMGLIILVRTYCQTINGATSNPTGACNTGVPFLKTGNGYQCFIIYNWKIGFNYRLQFSRLPDSNGNEQWQGSIYDYSGNSNTIIGNLLVPPTYGQLGAMSSTWNEYATGGSCDTVPTSVIFSYPYAMNTAGNHAPPKAQATYGNSTCLDST